MRSSHGHSNVWIYPKLQLEYFSQQFNEEDYDEDDDDGDVDDDSDTNDDDELDTDMIDDRDSPDQVSTF